MSFRIFSACFSIAFSLAISASAQSPYCEWLNLKRMVPIFGGDHYCGLMDRNRPQSLLIWSRFGVSSEHSLTFESTINIASGTVDRFSWMRPRDMPKELGRPESIAFKVRQSDSGMGTHFIFDQYSTGRHVFGVESGTGFKIQELPLLRITTFQGFRPDPTPPCPPGGDCPTGPGHRWANEYETSLVYLPDESVRTTFLTEVSKAIAKYSPTSNPNAHSAPTGWCEELEETLEALQTSSAKFAALGANCNGKAGWCFWTFNGTSEEQMWNDFGSTVLAFRSCQLDHDPTYSNHPYEMLDVSMAANHLKSHEPNHAGERTEWFYGDGYRVELIFHEADKTLYLEVEDW